MKFLSQDIGATEAKEEKALELGVTGPQQWDFVEAEADGKALKGDELTKLFNLNLDNEHDLPTSASKKFVE